MIRTSEAPLWIVIFRNILIASFAGILFGCLLFPLYAAVLRAIKHGTLDVLAAGPLFEQTLQSPILLFISFPFWVPLVALACLVGICFQKSIQKKSAGMVSPRANFGLAHNNIYFF
jgi:hypothetical protein